MPNFVGKGGNPFARGVVNGWQVSGIVQAYSGVNLQMTSKDANFGLQAVAPDGSGLSSPWVTGTNATRLMPRLTCDPSQNLQDGQYINPSCFAPPVAGSLNSGIKSIRRKRNQPQAKNTALKANAGTVRST